jgi:hypothetical protein
MTTCLKPEEIQQELKEVQRPVQIPVVFRENAGSDAIEIKPAPGSAKPEKNEPSQERTTNSFARAFTAWMIFLLGFMIAATGIIMTSARLAAIGCAILFGGAGLYGLLLI